MPRKGNRKELFFSHEELQLLRFAQKLYGLDMTAVCKLLIRSAIIELICEWKQKGVPRLPKDIEDLVRNF